MLVTEGLPKDDNDNQSPAHVARSPFQFDSSWFVLIQLTLHNVFSPVLCMVSAMLLCDATSKTPAACYSSSPKQQTFTKLTTCHDYPYLCPYS